MIKLIAITFSLTLSFLMLASISWFEKEQLKVESINKEHLVQIEKLRKIGKINTWLDNVVKPLLISLPKTQKEAESNLISYFDTHQQNYTLSVKQFIHKDDVAIYLLNDFSLDRSKLNILESFTNVHYPYGFLQFQEFSLNKKNLQGTLLLIQPFYGEDNVSKH